MKKIVSIALVSLFSIFLMTGCAQDDHKAELKQAFDNVATLESVRTDITAVLGMTGEDASASQDFTFTGTMETIGTKKAHVEINLPTIVSSSLGISKYVVYTETTDTATIVYTYDGKTWAKQSTVLPDETATATASPTIDVSGIYADFIDAAEYKGEETVDDSACYKYELTLKWDMLIDAIEKIAEDNPELMEGYDSSYTALLKSQLSAYPAIDMVIWVDKAEVNIKQISLDASETVKALYEAYATSDTTATGGISKLTLTIKYYDYNAVDDIVIPDAAKNAKTDAFSYDPTSILGQ